MTVNREESPSLIKDAKEIRCKPENHVPFVAVSTELRSLGVLLKASGDQLQIPGARALGDRS